MNYQNYQPQSFYNNQQKNPSTQDIINSNVLRNSGQNILGNRKPSLNGNQNEFSQFYDNNPMAKQNFQNHQQRQIDFIQRQQQYNGNIINQSNKIRAQEENLREIDRLNKINSEIVRKQYIDQMNDVKNAQGNVNAVKQNSFRPNVSQQSNHSAYNSQNRLPQSPPKRQIYSSGQPNYQELLEGKNKSNQQFYQNNPPMQQPFVPQFNPYQQRPRNFDFPMYNRDIDDYEDSVKPIKQIGSAIQKQSEIMAKLINKLDQNNPPPPPNQFDYQKRQFDEYDRFMKLQQNLMDFKYSQPQVQQPQIPQQQDANNMMIQMMYQQQMMQALMYAQLQRNQDKQVI